MISKTKSSYYKRRMEKLFKEVPEAKFVRERYRTLRYCLLEHHVWLEEVPKGKVIEFLREAIYLDRLLRLQTEKVERSTKKVLSDQFIQENLYATNQS